MSTTPASPTAPLPPLSYDDFPEYKDHARYDFVLPPVGMSLGGHKVKRAKIVSSIWIMKNKDLAKRERAENIRTCPHPSNGAIEVVVEVEPA